MTSRERVLQAFAHREPDRSPFGVERTGIGYGQPVAYPLEGAT